MSARVILMTGLYDTLDIFTYELKYEFINMGLEVMEFNTKDMKESLYSLMKFIEKPVNAVVTFNNLGFNMELKKGENIWEVWEFPVLIY